MKFKLEEIARFDFWVELHQCFLPDQPSKLRNFAW